MAYKDQQICIYCSSLEGKEEDAQTQRSGEVDNKVTVSAELDRRVQIQTLDEVRG